MAESFAETEFKGTVVAVANVKTLLDTSSLAATNRCTEVKSLAPHATFKELLDTGVAFINALPVAPSYVTFVRVYHSGKWCKVIRWRQEGQHALCNECEKLKEYRRQCHSAQDASAILKAYHVHLGEMMADRALDSTLNMRAMQSVLKGGCVDGAKLLSFTVDGMDTSKYRCPRNLVLTKDLEGAFRPELRMVGVLAEGMLEGFFLIPDLTAKDSNLTISLVNHSLCKIVSMLKSQNLPLPEEMRIHSDNAPSDQKNQHMLKYCSWMVASGFFKRCTMSMFRRGHSHSKIDQRFSEVRGSLSRAKLLEDPLDFHKAISSGVLPRQNRQLHVEIVHGSYNWKKFLEDHMGSSVSGHVQTHAMTEKNLQACHYFEFCRRADLSSDRAAMIDQPSGFEAYGNDIIMECKLYLASKNFAQLPLVFTPASTIEAIPSHNMISVAPKHELAEKIRKEYGKTAEKVAAMPWNMKKAEKFLKTLCGDTWKTNCALQHLPQSPKEWAASPTLQDTAAGPAVDTAFVYRTPAPVTVKLATAAKTKAAPAQAVAAAKEAATELAADFPQPPSVVGSGSPAPATPSDVGDDGLPPGSTPRQPALKRPASSSLPKAKAKAKVKAAAAPTPKASPKRQAAPKTEAAPKAKAKAKAKAINIPPGVTLGCSKCKQSAKGCAQCRKRAGMTFDPESESWN